MSNITSQIESILDKRLGRNAYADKGRLQKIERKMAVLKDILEKTEALDALIATVNREIESRSGDYYKLLCNDIETQLKFQEVSCETAKTRLKKVISELENLKTRFSRKSLRIAFIGRERQGKSTFLQTITGLSNKVIPAYSGNSCTGAVSVIHNSTEPLRVDIQYYSVKEFLQTVNEKLERFFPDKKYMVHSLSDIKQLVLPDRLDSPNDSLVSEYNKFKKSYIEHYNEYYHLIGKDRTSYFNEDEIATHVAQYEEFQDEVPGSEKIPGRGGYKKSYYKYIAVKGVDIYKTFDVDITKQLELVDTIGIGSAADSELVEEEMYRVLREDCDAAINLFKPGDTAGLSRAQTELLNKLRENLPGRDPSKWIVFILNKVTCPAFNNEASIAELLPELENTLKSNKEPSVAWVKAVNGSNFDDVSENLIAPLLTLIAENLDNLDTQLMSNVEILSKAAYSECYSLERAASSVITSSLSGGGNKEIKKLFTSLEKDINAALNKLDEGKYARNKEHKCEELINEYELILKQVGKHIPSEEDILENFRNGALLTPETAFEQKVEQLRNDIFDQFEVVNYKVLFPLQEKVKVELIQILFEQGRLKNLSLGDFEPAPTQDWLEKIISEYVDEEQYPALHNALRFILDYQLNIEGLVEYNIAKALHIIDRTHQDFIRFLGDYEETFEGRANGVWQELINRIRPVKERMNAWIGDFALIPNHSFYSRVHKFHIKLRTDEEGVEDFENFCMDNSAQIWRDDIIALSKRQKAFGDWAERVNNLKSVITSDNFKIC